MKPLCQPLEVQAPIFRAVGGVMRAEMPAVKKHEMRPAAGFEIAGANAVDFYIFFILHGCSLRLETLKRKAADASCPVTLTTKP